MTVTWENLYPWFTFISSCRLYLTGIYSAHVHVLKKLHTHSFHRLIIYLFTYEINTKVETFPEAMPQSSGMNDGLELKIK